MKSLGLLFTLAVYCWAAVASAVTPSTGEKLARITGEFEAYSYATGLSSPDGLAFHPITHELYVSEETAGRVSVIRDGRSVTVLGPKINVADLLPKWAPTDRKSRAEWLKAELVSPEGISFSKDGTLFVVEDSPSGRLIEFDSTVNGGFAAAHVIPIPWSAEPFAWEGITVASDGRVFLAGSSAESETMYKSGCVLMRDPDKDWWIVDYGPFAMFSSVGLSRDEDILIVGDEGVGGVTWWDTLRQRELDTVSKRLGRIEGVCTLPDGAILVAQEDSDNAGGRLTRIDPTTGESTTVAEGFGSIESVILAKETGYLYVTEDSTGSILELRPTKPVASDEYLLKRTVQVAEAKQGVAPKKAPQFMTDFFKELGITLVNEGMENAATPTRSGAERGKAEFTLEELGAHIPMIAGKVTMDEAADPSDPDPVVEINFINLFPNRVTRTADSLNPSMCFFAAKRRSGRVDRTQPLMGFIASKRDHEGGWKELSRNAALYLPLTTCSAQSDDKGVTVTMCFLGLDVFKDYYLTLQCGKENSGSLSTDGAGGRLVSTKASIVDIGAGGEEQVNVVMTGMLPKKRGGMGWLNIGKHNKWSMVLPERGPWISRWLETNMREFVHLLREKDRDMIMAIQALPEEDQKQAEKTDATDPIILTGNEDEKEPVIIEDHAKSIEEDESGQSLTNIILSKVFDVWNQKAF